jgi:hypothetical protein
LDWLHKLGLDPTSYGLVISEFDWEAPDHGHAAPAAAVATPEPKAAEASVEPELQSAPAAVASAEAPTEPEVQAEPAAAAATETTP